VEIEAQLGQIAESYGYLALEASSAEANHALGKKHRCLTTRPHPNGPPFGYCRTCSLAVVRFLDMWWHLEAEAPTPPSRNKDGYE